MSQEQDKEFFRNFIFILIGLSMLMAIFITFGIMLGGLKSTGDTTAEIMANTAPVAKIQIQGDKPEVEEAAAMEETANLVVVGDDDAENNNAGKATYDSICIACHGSGIPNIPQLGDTDAWAPRIGQGNDLLYERAIAGYLGASGMPMPAKGGNPSLSDDAVKAAVDYMVANSQ